jgi:hypothetical protein
MFVLSLASGIEQGDRKLQVISGRELATCGTEEAAMGAYVILSPPRGIILLNSNQLRKSFPARRCLDFFRIEAY